MRGKYRNAGCAVLYAVSVCLYLLAQQSVVSGSTFSFDYITRMILCVLAILGVAGAAFVWRSKCRWGRICKIIITVVLVGLIAATRFRENRISCPVAAKDTTGGFSANIIIRL